MPVAIGGWRDRKYRRALDTQTPRPNRLLDGQDSVYQGPGRAPTYDWQLPPRGRPFPVALRGFTAFNPSIQLAGQDRIYGENGQAAAYDTSVPPRGRPSPVANRTWTQALVDKFLDLAAPFNELNWPVPNGRPFPIENRGFVHQMDRQLAGQDAVYGAAGESPVYVWTVPPGPQAHRENRTFLHRVDIQLAGQDAIYGAAGESPVYVWVVPPGARRTPGLTFTHATDQQLIGQDTFYGAPGETSPSQSVTSLPPRGQPFPIINRTWTQAIVEKFLILVGLPFNQLDWPVPWGKVPPRENRTHIVNGTRYIGLDTFYGAPGETSANQIVTNLPPTGRPFPVANRTWLQVLVDKFLVVVAPFNQLDWPVPFRKTPPNANRTHTTTGTGYIGQDQFYAEPGRVITYDWQLPPSGARPRSPELRTYTATGTGYIGQDIIPGGGEPGQVPAYDWQVPTPAKPRESSLRTWVRSLVNWFLPEPVIPSTLGSVGLGSSSLTGAGVGSSAVDAFAVGGSALGESGIGSTVTESGVDAGSDAAGDVGIGVQKT